MAMLNRVELIGNLGADPEIRRTPAGQAICSFTHATSENWRDRYATEVVLQGYHARLLMMDRRANGREAGGPDEDASGDRFGVSKPLRATEEFNDDIPF
jgi:single-stranded DNA-binding protein